MSEPFKAETRYHDLVGTIAIEEFQAIGIQSFSLLDQLKEHASIPNGYSIIGFEIPTANPMEMENHGIMLYHAICIKPDDVGEGANQWHAYAEENGELPVFRFRGTVNFEEFRQLIHSLDIKVHVGVLEGINLQVQPSVQ